MAINATLIILDESVDVILILRVVFIYHLSGCIALRHTKNQQTLAQIWL